MIDRIKDFLQSDWSSYFPDISRPTVIRGLISRGSYGKHTKTTFILFADAQPTPFAVVKVPLFEDGAQFIRQEYEVLTRLQRQLPRHVDFGLPGCWLITGLEKTPILLETALRGDPLRKAAKRRRGDRLLTIGMQWVERLHQLTRVDHTFTETDYQALVAAPIDMALDHSPVMGLEAAPLTAIALRLQRLVGTKMPLVCSHNDFRVSNLRIQDHSLSVYDWEFAAWPGLPMLDLLNFAVDYCMETRGASFAQACISMLSEDNQGSRGAHAALRSYCAQMGIDECVMPLWLDLFLIHKLHLAQQVLLPLQIFDGLEWIQGLGRALGSRGTTEAVW